MAEIIDLEKYLNERGKRFLALITDIADRCVHLQDEAARNLKVLGAVDYSGLSKEMQDDYRVTVGKNFVLWIVTSSAFMQILNDRAEQAEAQPEEVFSLLIELLEDVVLE